MDIKNPQVGGAEIILYEIAKRLVERGHKITWFCRSFAGGKEKEIIDGIEIMRRGNKYNVYFEAYKYYRSLARKPDKVIESVNTVCWQTPLYIPRGKRIAYVNQLAREVFYYELPSIISNLAYILEDWEYKTYKNTSFMCYSESTKADLIKIGIPKENIHLFPIGLDHKRYYPGEKSKEPLFLCVSRLVQMKRVNLVISAMKRVVEKYPKTKLAVIGYGYQRNDLGKLRHKLKLENNVFFIDEDILFFGKNSKDKKVEFMQKSWALIFPSVKEGWGMTVTECAACGTPAIITDVTGLKDSVIKNKTGLIISKNPTLEELSSAMIKIIKNERLRESLSKQALKWSTNFSWVRAADKCLQLIQSI